MLLYWRAWASFRGILMRRSESERCAEMVSLAYREPLNEDALKLYATLIADLDYAAAVAAIHAHIQTEKWRPTVAELRERVAAATLSLPEPELAWGEVLRQISSYGCQREGRPQWSCPEIARAVEAVGWRSICLEEHVPSSRRSFLDAYASLHKTAHSREALRMPRDESLGLRAPRGGKALGPRESEDEGHRGGRELSEAGRLVLAKYGKFLADGE